MKPSSLAEARRRGRKGGRPSAFKEGDVTAARALVKEGKLPVRDVAKRMGVSVATLYRHVGKRGTGDDAADAVAARIDQTAIRREPPLLTHSSSRRLESTRSWLGARPGLIPPRRRPSRP